MSDSFIDYGQLIDDAMHIIVKQTLQRVAKEGLPGSHHFFISFLTTHPGVELSERLRKKYPSEMTIVLQYQFEDLRVGDKEFAVVLSFDNIKEKINIPFEALTAFADPSVKFGLQFRHLEEEIVEAPLGSDVATKDKLQAKAEENGGVKNAGPAAAKGDQVKKSGAKSKSSTNVVKLDTFRKKDK